MTTRKDVELVLRGKRYLKELDRRLSSDYMAFRYANRLYGGWTHPDGRWIERPHTTGLKIHASVKALYCPECHSRIGLAATEEDVEVSCPEHGSMPWRKAFTHRTIMARVGNRGGKDHAMLAEFASWVIGVRPWDGSLTAPHDAGRDWMIACETLSTSANTIIIPFLEERLGWEKDGGWIRKRVDATTNAINHYILKNGRRIHIRSYEHSRKVYEGVDWAGIYWSEPMPEELREASLRGLVSGRGRGWGRELIAATPLDDAYLMEVCESAWNYGGDKRHIFVVTGTIYDNPSLTKRDIAEFLADIPEEKRTARALGTFLNLSGSVFERFGDANILPYTMTEKVLGTEAEPSAWPLICAIDPHDDKPWYICWIALSPLGDKHIVMEWPDGDFFHMRRDRRSFDEYAQIVTDMEASLPGGSGRVLWRAMDPRFGSTAKAGMTKTVCEEMQDRGYFFETEVFQEIEVGHGQIKNLLNYDVKKPIDALNRPHIFVHECCPTMLKAFRRYAWLATRNRDRKNTSKVSERFKDPIDALRYALSLQVSHEELPDWRDDRGSLGRQEESLTQDLTAWWD